MSLFVLLNNKGYFFSPATKEYVWELHQDSCCIKKGNNLLPLLAVITKVLVNVYLLMESYVAVFVKKEKQKIGRVG